MARAAMVVPAVALAPGSAILTATCKGVSAVLRVEVAPPKADDIVVDLSGVERMDTVGAWLVHKLERDRGARIVGATREQQLLIDHVTAADQPVLHRLEHRLGDLGDAGFGRARRGFSHR